MADILETKLADIESLTTEARSILADEREAMRRECEARVALALDHARTMAAVERCDPAKPCMACARCVQEAQERLAAARAMREAAVQERDTAERKVCELREVVAALVEWAEIRNATKADDSLLWPVIAGARHYLANTDDIAGRWVAREQFIDIENRLGDANCERDSAIARAKKAEARAKALESPPTPTPSNARVKVDHMVLAGVLDTYATNLAQQRPTLTVPQAVALQALLGDHLPEGAIVIEGSSELDPEEVTP